MLAVGLSLTLTSAPMMVPPPVHANAYSDRVAVMEQRRKLLAETYVIAFQNASVAPCRRYSLGCDRMYLHARMFSLKYSVSFVNKL